MKENNNLTLYIATSCPYCVRVTNFMAQKNLTGIKIIDTYWDPLEHQRLKKKYGKSQVPLLLINDSPLYESLDIIRYLEEQYDIS